MFIANAKELQAAGRQIFLPFRILLPLSQPALTCAQALRILPCKRLTCVGEWKGEKVIAKLFFDRWRWHRHGRREKKGSDILHERGIAAPALLFAGKAEGLNVYVAIFEYLENGQNLSQLAPSLINEMESCPSLTALVSLLAVEHQKGIIHCDLHLDNFLWRDSIVYQLDAGAVSATVFHTPLWQHDSLYYLAMLLSQFLSLPMPWVDRCLVDYMQQRNWVVTPALRNQWYRLLGQQKKRRYAISLKKIFKDCSAIVFSKTFRTLLAVERAEDSFGVKQLLSRIDELLGNPACLLKNGNTCTVGKVEMNHREYVIKRYNLKNSGHRLRCALHRTRAEKSWYNAHYLLLLGIPTAKPVALSEERWGPLRGKAYFMCRFLPGPLLEDYLLHEPSAAKRQQVAGQLVDLLNRLFLAGLSHGDLKSTNFIVVKDVVHLIDLDSLQAHKTGWGLRRAWKNDWDRFMRNWQNHPDFGALFASQGSLFLPKP